MAWLYVPGLEGSNWDSNLALVPDIGVWVTASGKPTRRGCSWRGWRTKPWIQRLFGTILNHSRANSTAEKWISSLRGSRVNRSHSRDVEKGPRTRAGFGLPFSELLAMWDPDTSSWKTSQGSSQTRVGWEPFSGAWPKQGLMLDGMCFRPMKLGLRNKGNGSSFWPTPVANQDHGTRGTSRSGKNLRQEATQWPTPRAGDPDKRGVIDPRNPRNGLPGKVANWPTPTASDVERGGNDRQRQGGPSLRHYVRQKWPTPSAMDAEGFLGRPDKGRSGPNSGRTLVGKALELYGEYSPQDPLPPGKITMVLNPPFVEALMGWPIGWTAFEPVGMEWSRWWQLMRSELLRLEPAS